MARSSLQVVGRGVLSNDIKLKLSQEIKSHPKKLAPASVGRSQIPSYRTPTLRQECNAIAATLNDVAANSYEELRAIRHALLTQLRATMLAASKYVSGMQLGGEAA